MAGPVKISGKLVGAETVRADLYTLERSFRAKLKAEVQAQGQELAGLAASLAPRKTGALAASIRSVGVESRQQIVSEIGTDIKNKSAYYGRFQESGWTPNPGQTFAGTRDVLGPYGPASVSIRRAGVKRNPRNAKGWKDYARQKGGRKIYAHPFLKPALAQLRGRFRDRLVTLTQSMDL